jgi:hypothetical protein
MLNSAIVSTLVVVGFIAVLLTLLVHPVSLVGDIADIFKVLVGALSTQFVTVVQYHLGSSAGSRAKDEIIAGMTPPPK